ncbi:MAG: SurA N-terminal domain-containing protein [Elusimicrobia bacterium]|nr:SurA N-terminal domain-containing protein [Elusimicrobiota bacterium]
MMNFLRKHKVKIFLITILGFLAGTFVGFGSYMFGKKMDINTIAVVGKAKIPYKLYFSLYNSSIDMLRQSGLELTEYLKTQTQKDIVRGLVQDEIIWQQTKKYGITVSDTELASDIQKYPLFLNDKGQFDVRYYYKFLNNLRLSPKEYETFRRKQIAANKLKVLIASSASVSDSELEEMKKEMPDLNKEYAIQLKANEVLNDWFEDIKSKTYIEINLNENI